MKARHVKFPHAATGVRWGLAPALLALLVCAAAAPAADIRMEVRYGFDGVARINRWSAVTVELENVGRERDGLLLLAPLDRRFANAFERRVTAVRLPQGSRQRHTLFWNDPNGAGLTPAAIFAGYASREPQVNYIGEDQTFVVTVGFAPGALGYLARVQRVRLSAQSANVAAQGMPQRAGNIVPAYVTPAYLPESPVAYFPVDMLVLGPVFASDLSPAAQAAIEEWVRTGGDLVVVGGADVARLGDPFFRELLPVEGLVASSTPIRAGLRGFGIAVSTPAAVVVGVPKPGAKVLAGEPGVPLVVRGRVGNGTVTFLAFDPTQPPVSAASGLEDLWLALFRDRERLYSLQEIAGASEYNPGLQSALYNDVTSIKEMQAPPLLMIVGFLTLYFLMLIPINHWALGRRGRRELAWVTTPVIVAVFFVGAYVLGYNIRGPRLLVNQRTIVEAGEGSPQGLALSTFSIFSPARRSYDIHVGLKDAVVSETTSWNYGYGPYGPGGPVPSGAGLIHDEREPWVERAQIPMWGMKVYDACGVADMGGPIRGSVTRTATGFGGFVENGTKYSLRHVRLYVPGGKGGLQLGDMAPGMRIDIEQAAKAAAPPPARTSDVPGRRPQVRGPGWRVNQWQQAAGGMGSLQGAAVSALVPPQRLVSEVGLVGQIDETPVPIEVGRVAERDSQTLLVASLPLEVGQRHINVPAGTYAVKCDRPSGGFSPVLARDPDAVFTFTPPLDLAHLKVTSVTVEYQLLAGGAAGACCDVLMLDAKAGAWHKVGSAGSFDAGRGPVMRIPPGGRPATIRGAPGAWGAPQRLKVARAGRFVAADGTIKVKMVKRPEVDQVTVSDLNILVEGDL
jgi:hypothetical protein